MCRWMAYSGDPILAEDLLFRPVAFADRSEPAFPDGRDDDQR